MEASLTPAQHAAVTSDAAPLCVLAGAGAGKTRVLTRRIAHRVSTGQADPAHVLALTFTRKAAGELIDRLRALDVRDRVTAGTFHGLAYAQLRRLWADRRQTPPAILDRKLRLLTELVKGRPQAADAPVAELASEIEWARARLVDPDHYPEAAIDAGRRPPIPCRAMASLYARYETEKQRRRLVDFDDLLIRCAQAIESDPEFGAAQRWRWRHVFVDEFQDVNPLQHRLLRAWLGDTVDLCVVGDPNQAVYAWNGADSRLLKDFADHWPGATVIALDDNHRSSPQVVRAAAAILGADGAHLRSTRPDGPAPTVRSYRDDRAEAHGVAAEVRHAHATGMAWSQLAVLARTNAQAAAFVDALRAAGVPYRTAGAETDPSSPVYETRHEPTDAVTLCTFHRAKGLEWPAVWVVGLEAGLVPIGHATSPEAEEEERRLLYVALTRAERELHCSWAERRTFDGRTMPRDPSPWLETIGATIDPDGAGNVDEGDPQILPRSGSWQRHLAGQRRQLARARSRTSDKTRPLPSGPPGLSEPDTEILAALQRWRASVAKAAGVPTYVLFHDATLAALAATRPASANELLAVPGVGPVKASRYGTILLEIVAEHRKTA